MVETYPDLAGLLVADPPDGPAVYFLLDRGIVVYVGASESPCERVEQHADKDFDSYLFLPVADLADLAGQEAHWIGAFAPKYNRQHNPLCVCPKGKARPKGAATVGIRPELLDGLRAMGRANYDEHLGRLVNRLVMEGLQRYGFMESPKLPRHDPLVRWVDVETQLPADGAVVRAFCPNGVDQTLRYSEGRWYLVGHHWPVQFVPLFWRPIEANLR